MLQVTEVDDMDYEELNEALKIMTDLVTFLNEHNRRRDVGK